MCVRKEVNVIYDVGTRIQLMVGDVDEPIDKRLQKSQTSVTSFNSNKLHELCFTHFFSNIVSL